MARQPTLEELHYQQAIADFPFERIETTGEQAFRTWEQLRSSGRGVPVVLGGDEEFPNLMEPFYPSSLPRRDVTEILAAAASLSHPEDLARRRSEEEAAAREALNRHIPELQARSSSSTVSSYVEGILKSYAPGATVANLSESLALLAAERREPEVGEWPADIPSPPSPPVGSRFGKPLTKVHIALVPTADWTTIPAHLLWGGWNDCPRPEYHVAALRYWRDRFGAELIGLGHDTMHLRVAQRPQTRAAALELVHEHYLYCSGIVDQGTGTLAPLAAELMGSDWWFFWWD
jgi:hypothetical protein